jgi:hypothetical protein
VNVLNLGAKKIKTKKKIEEEEEKKKVVFATRMSKRTREDDSNPPRAAPHPPFPVCDFSLLFGVTVIGSCCSN